MPTPAAAQTGQRLFIARNDLHQVKIAADPDAPASRPLAEGEARLALQHFALTANNITYAAFGEAMKYWQFFPAPDAAWGCLPVWGFAVVSESRAQGVAVGQRVYGYFPAGSHLVVTPGRVRETGFVDTATHRQELAAAYQQYVFCAADPGWQPRLEGLQAVLKPLFVTSFLIDDFLSDNRFFGARQLLLSSASSKTAAAMAFCLSRRADRPRVVGLTSGNNVDYTRALGCYDAVHPYESVPAALPVGRAVYVDFAGSASLRASVHHRFGDGLMHSAAVGGAHWESLASGITLPGPRPTLFFAPAQAAIRSAEWGSAELRRRVGQRWTEYLARVVDPRHPWMVVVRREGRAAVQDAWLALVDGRSDPRQGWLLSV